MEVSSLLSCWLRCSSFVRGERKGHRLHRLDAEPLKELAVRADQLWLTRTAGGTLAVATVSAGEFGGEGNGGCLGEDPVAAVSRGGFGATGAARVAGGLLKQGSFGKQPSVAGSGSRGGAGCGPNGGNDGSKGQHGIQTVAVCWRHRKSRWSRCCHQRFKLVRGARTQRESRCCHLWLKKALLCSQRGEQ